MKDICKTKGKKKKNIKRGWPKKDTGGSGGSQIGNHGQ